MMWAIEKNGNYLRLTYDGARVADFFPWAGKAAHDPEWIIDQANRITLRSSLQRQLPDCET
jgi:hypothetical protein